MEFINSRFRFYSNEVDNMNISRDEGDSYIPTKIYTAFYLTPLAQEIAHSSDLFEIMKFFLGLSTMMRWVNENAKII